VTNPYKFTNRGLIWAASLDWWQRSPFTGLGSTWYARVGSTSDRLAGSVFNGHNQLVHLLVTGGILLAVLVALQVVVAAVRSGEIAASGSLAAVGYLGTLAGACVLEKAFAIVDNAPMMTVTVVPLTVLICGQLTRAPRDDATTTGRNLSPEGRAQPSGGLPRPASYRGR
jgi:O-antigen ligase